MIKKAIIVSAPSGAGKTTIVRHLLAAIPALEFSISACSREKRENEIHGKDYYFITVDEFRKKIINDEFVEWQEVYPGCFYGTLKSELERIWSMGRFPIFDVDVYGGLNLKRYFGLDSLAVFIRPPSINELENRLKKRGCDDEEAMKKRLNKAEQELSVADYFDKIIVNDDLAEAKENAVSVITRFLLP
jgi:guanylate kinase